MPPSSTLLKPFIAENHLEVKVIHQDAAVSSVRIWPWWKTITFFILSHWVSAFCTFIHGMRQRRFNKQVLRNRKGIVKTRVLCMYTVYTVHSCFFFIWTFAWWKLCRYKCYIMLVCWHSIELSVILQFFSFTWIWDNRKCCEQKHVISAGDVLFDGAQELKARSQPCGLLYSVKASTHRMRRSNSTLSSLHSSNKLIMCLSFYSAVGELVNLH